MFSKRKQDDTNQHVVSTSPKQTQTADERVAQMFAKSKASNDSKPNVSQKLDVELLVAEMRLASKSQLVPNRSKRCLQLGRTLNRRRP